MSDQVVRLLAFGDTYTERPIHGRGGYAALAHTMDQHTLDVDTLRLCSGDVLGGRFVMRARAVLRCGSLTRLPRTALCARCREANTLSNYWTLCASTPPVPGLFPAALLACRVRRLTRSRAPPIR